MPEKTSEFIEEEDQWFTHGWRFENNTVYSFTTDRKEQNAQRGRLFTIDEFFEDENIDIKAKRWLKNILGDSCDIILDEDVWYK